MFQRVMPKREEFQELSVKNVVRPLGLVPIQETQVCAYMIARLDEP